jgi:hypothetical protein
MEVWMIILVEELARGRYSASVEGRLLVKSVRTPLDMRGKLSWFAARTVSENEGGGPTWRKFWPLAERQWHEKPHV